MYRYDDIHVLICMFLYPVVRAKIFDVRTEPSSPIEGTDLFCLADGMSVNIICQNYGFPVAIVEFTKDSILVDPELDDRYV